MNRSSILTTFFFIICCVILIGGAYFLFNETEEIQQEDPFEEYIEQGYSIIQKNYTFSTPTIKQHKQQTHVYVTEADLNDVHDQWPVLPVNLTTYTFPMGTKIIDIVLTNDTEKTLSISDPLSYGSCSTATNESKTIYQQDTPYPSTHMRYHLGGGRINDSYSTILNIRLYPVTYTPSEDQIHYIQNTTITVIYKEPETPFTPKADAYDLLIIAPETFQRPLQPLINHKQEHNIETQLITLEEIEDTQSGKDTQEKIKYQIKQEIEESGIDYVLLVGGIDGQSTRWHLPIRYSRVIIREGTQEFIEPTFISDLYFADIYDSEGNFSSWDTNNNGIFAEYDEGIIDTMDLYPDVAVGRIPCRDAGEVRTIVDKIITYETKTTENDWFKNIVLISGDHWADDEQINEGVLIMDEAARIMRDFEPTKLYVTEDDTFYIRDINKAINKGAGFVYFCGHGSNQVWGIHNPPDATGWTPTAGPLGLFKFYKTQNMNLLRNRNKLPITLVGGCFNGQYDISRMLSLKQGKIQFHEHCWAWHLTIQKRGGSIATIANTGLGTHAMGDADNNQVNDYLEVYDGWLELTFLELYNKEHVQVIGETHMQAMTLYLNRFLGAQDEMDIKMVQQWQLFGDPSLKIGGY